MKREYFALAIFTVIIFSGALLWNDDFDDPYLNVTKWTAREGNWTPEYHLARNVTMQNGILTITAKPEEYEGLHYTSGMISTQFKADWRYGRIEVRAKMPSGIGLLPAIWMMPASMPLEGWNIDWARTNGEIDIAETSTQWWGDHWVKCTLWYGASITENAGYYHSFVDITQDFHVFRLDWRKGIIRWYVDGNLYKETRTWFSTNGAYPHPFDDNFFLIIMLGVWPPGITELKQMLVDWVRIYEVPPLYSIFLPVMNNWKIAYPAPND